MGWYWKTSSVERPVISARPGSGLVIFDFEPSGLVKMKVLTGLLAALISDTSIDWNLVPIGIGKGLNRLVSFIIGPLWHSAQRPCFSPLNGSCGASSKNSR